MRKSLLTVCFLAFVVVGGMCFHRAITFEIDPPDVWGVMAVDTIIGLTIAGAVFTFAELFTFPGSFDARTRVTINIVLSCIAFCVIASVLLSLHRDVLRRHSRFAIESLRRTEVEARARFGARGGSESPAQE